jgi:predicted RNA-binding protein associated with RNAse of E/G family
MKTTLFRERIIPKECIELKDDIILFQDSEIIVTRWKTLKPKKNMDHGYSCYFLKEGFKVSKFMNAEDKLVYWYCDIIEHLYIEETDTYYFVDLLADVIIYPDNSVQVVDLEELADALDSHSLSVESLQSALRSLSKLLKIIYSGNFASLQQPIIDYQ